MVAQKAVFLAFQNGSPNSLDFQALVGIQTRIPSSVTLHENSPAMPQPAGDMTLAGVREARITPSGFSAMTRSKWLAGGLRAQCQRPVRASGPSRLPWWANTGLGGRPGSIPQTLPGNTGAIIASSTPPASCRVAELGFSSLPRFG